MKDAFRAVELLMSMDEEPESAGVRAAREIAMRQHRYHLGYHLQFHGVGLDPSANDVYEFQCLCGHVCWVNGEQLRAEIMRRRVLPYG